MKLEHIVDELEIELECSCCKKKTDDIEEYKMFNNYFTQLNYKPKEYGFKIWLCPDCTRFDLDMPSTYEKIKQVNIELPGL